MSIIAASATQPTAQELVGGLAILVVLLIPGLIVFWRTRAYLPAMIAGPMRVPAFAPLWPIPIAGVIAFAAWQGSTILYFAFLAAVRQSAGATMPSTEAEFMAMIGPTDFIVLVGVGPIVGLLAGAGFLFLVRREALSWIGFKVDHFIHAAGIGLLAAIFAIPATMLIGTIVEIIYRAIDFQHPTEHDLLKFMRDAPSDWIRGSAIIAAVLVAPLVEEFIFRGLLQTTLVTWLSRIGRNQNAAMSSMAMPAMPAESVARPAATPPLPEKQGEILPAATVWLPPVPLAYQDAPTSPQVVAYATPRPPAWCAWLGVALTSLLFALVHPLWTAPIIFFLSLVLGYLYERTGNLWAVILLHATFNAVNTAFFLSGAAN